MHTLRQLFEHGQSYWLDNLTRSMIRTGELKRRVTSEGLRGITSNPATFEKALAASKEYDAQIRKLSGEEYTLPRIYENLVVADARDACDVLRPVFDDSEGGDGFVSLEVSPHLAYSTEQTIAEARRLWNTVSRPNLLVKIPGTPESIPAIRQALYEGINVNITLLFSVANYEEVAEAFLTALEQRVSEGDTIRTIASVASFFISRIDSEVDQLLGERWSRSRTIEERARVAALFGKAGIANARLAYQAYKRICATDRWARLRDKGVRPQRLLWASTGTKDPLYRDVRYVESLLGPNTVITMPEQTADAFARQGRICAGSLESDLDAAGETFLLLATLGIQFDHVASELQEDGIRKFVQPFDALMVSLTRKRRQFLGKKLNRQQLSPTSQAVVKAGVQALDVRRFVTRLYAKDGSLWTVDPQVARLTQQRLGWLDSPSAFLERVDEIQTVAEAARREGFKHTVIVGMGGSSLAPEVCARTFGAARGWPDLVVLDNTDPYSISHLLSQIEPSRSLFVISSKSGNTIETISFYRYFYETLAGRSGVPGNSFLAITDPGTWLAKEAAAKRFRHCFTNPPDIPGRYSALSYFGLVPMALMGIDIRTFLKRAAKLQVSSGPGLPAAGNPAVELGAFVGMQARKGRDKLTFVLSDTISSLGDWLEQLVAESTGKEGRGIVPVVGEPLAAPGAYGRDRLFVYISHAAADNKVYDKRLAALEKGGHPVVRILLPDRMGLAEEFLRWELATVTSASILGVNPFDEPNVAETTKNTNDLLASWHQKRRFEIDKPAAGNKELAVYGPPSARRPSPEKLITSFLDSVRPGDYLALLAYFRKTPARDRLLEQMRVTLRDRYKVATTVAYGPRYLHTTGQLHKGGQNSGVFLLLTSDAEEHLPIPGQDYDFATLQQAQALGDFSALQSKGRRVIRIHLGSELKPGLKRIAVLMG
ncbi:MAG: bifunctional transaldolase/phosoglucose isomerase [Acidobacteria bacterium]|nr:MAG: bifunctional transaldolase/phosoglucose isomerase [Acidobacteriota bacterium]